MTRKKFTQHRRHANVIIGHFDQLDRRQRQAAPANSQARRSADCSSDATPKPRDPRSSAAWIAPRLKPRYRKQFKRRLAQTKWRLWGQQLVVSAAMVLLLATTFIASYHITASWFHNRPVTVASFMGSAAPATPPSGLHPKKRLVAPRKGLEKLNRAPQPYHKKKRMGRSKANAKRSRQPL